jgi:hypothetical protein
MWHAWGKLETHMDFLPKTLNGRNHTSGPDTERKEILKLILDKYNMKVQIGFTSFKIGFNDGLL